MSSDPRPAELAKLREPFPASQVGKLPKGNGIELDYVGHGAVTARLLDIDPEWNWEPLGVDEHGLPALDEFGNLWIKLTVCGVTRLGVGDGQTMKILIGDAIRNAAMRFGVALDLWIKGHGEDDEKVSANAPQQRSRRSSPPPAPPGPGVRFCARCDLPLEGAVEKAAEGYVHAGGCVVPPRDVQSSLPVEA